MNNTKKLREVMDELNEVVEGISYSGYMSITESLLPKYSVAIQKLVTHNVILVSANKAKCKGEEDKIILQGGANYAEAQLKGGYNYIREVENEINPPRWMRWWNYTSTNPLLSNSFSGGIGFVLGWFIKYLSE